MKEHIELKWVFEVVEVVAAQVFLLVVIQSVVHFREHESLWGDMLLE
jgi:hypothetical protein